MHPRIWEASGHVASFNDPLVDCKTCKSRFRADHLIEEKLGQHVDGKPRRPTATWPAKLPGVRQPRPDRGPRSST